jgi:antitoxin component YwqK of YwqJK toxin-antitoxin module
LFYDGQWKDGKQHGNGFVYTANGAKKFIGTWVDGKQTFLRHTAFSEIAALQFYKKKGDIEIPKEEPKKVEL